MIGREYLLFLFGHCSKYSINRGCMALNKILSSSSNCTHSPLGPCNERSLFPRYVCAAAHSGLGVYSNNFLMLKGSLDHHDGVTMRIHDDLGKARAAMPFHEFIHESDIGFGEHRSPTFTNDQGEAKYGCPLGFPERPMPEKLVVAVDVDEVLGSFLAALNKFVADCYSSDHSVSDYYVYEFFKIWNCSRAEANIRVHEFFKTAYFKMGIYPIPGAQRVLHKMSPFCNLSVVTSRQNVIKGHTLEWIEKHYPGLFQEIHFGNHFALDGKARAKSEICRDLGAHVLIDDNPRYAVECAEAGIKVLLFDYDNSYPWSKCDVATSHPFVTKVSSWEEVEQCLVGFLAADNNVLGRRQH